MTGTQLAGRTRKIAADIPILIYTGHTEAVCRDTVASLGVHCVIAKPTDVKDIARTIQEAREDAD